MPIENDAFFSMLGIAMRAGALSLGEDGVLKAISGGKAARVLVDAGASENTKKRFAESCAYYGVELRLTGAGRLSAAIGRPGRMSAAVKAGGLCDKLRSLSQQS